MSTGGLIVWRVAAEREKLGYHSPSFLELFVSGRGDVGCEWRDGVCPLADAPPVPLAAGWTVGRDASGVRCNAQVRL